MRRAAISLLSRDSCLDNTKYKKISGDVIHAPEEARIGQAIIFTASSIFPFMMRGSCVLACQRFPRRDANDSNLYMHDVNNCMGNASSG